MSEIELWRQHPCGQPTRSGSPCKNQITGFKAACGTHSNPDFEYWEQRMHTAYLYGRQEEQKFGLNRANRIKELEDLVQSLRQEAREKQFPTRLYDDRHRQIVMVDTGYSYVWEGADQLSVGDRVIIPGNWLFKDAKEVEVTGMGTSYQGTLSSIVRKVS